MSNLKTGLRLKEKLPTRNHAEESQEQRENRLAAQGDNAKRKCAFLYKKYFIIR